MKESSLKNIRKKDLRPCQRCGHRFESTKAKCPSCSQWHVPHVANNNTDQTILLSDVSPNPLSAIKTGPWDTCFSQQGGIITTSVTLMGGAPGAGKSTMSLQLSDRIAEVTEREVIYIGTEESVQEIKNRANRLELKCMHRIRVHPMGSSADLGNILLARKPSAIILDSLPGLTTDADLAVELCKRFKDYAVELNAPVVIIDHVTKQDDFAGLMQLQHAVDTLLTLFPVDGGIRELSTMKNRFGPAQISVYMRMTEKGLILKNVEENEDEESEEYDGEEEEDKDEEIIESTNSNENA